MPDLCRGEATGVDAPHDPWTGQPDQARHFGDGEPVMVGVGSRVGSRWASCYGFGAALLAATSQGADLGGSKGRVSLMSAFRETSAMTAAPDPGCPRLPTHADQWAALSLHGTEAPR
jgi:hypothetical protein